MKWYRLFAGLCCLAPRIPAQIPADQLEFFEKKIRPVLVEKCYACHSKTTAQPMGGLRLDTRDGARTVIEPGDAARSKLITAISYQNLNLKMPPAGKLSDQQIADFTAWIRMGAPDPRVEEAAAAPVKKSINFAEARRFWSFQPIANPAPPNVKRADWPASAIDRFILARLEEKGLEPAAPADKRTLIRRVTFDLTGLPPTPQEVADFLADQSPTAFSKVVERLL